MGQLGQKLKIDILLFSAWLFFQLNFSAKLRIQASYSWDGNFIDDIITDQLKSWGGKILENPTKH